MAIPSLKSRAPDAAAKRRVAASSGSPVFRLCNSDSCVILDANAYRFSPVGNPTFSRGDR
jgi:hypothetical protein